MAMTMTKALRKRSALSYLYLGSLLFSFHAFFLSYIHSNYLSAFFSAKMIGIFWSLSALLTLILFANVCRILESIGNKKLFGTLLVLEILAILGIVYGGGPLMIAACFIAHQAIITLISFCLDIFLEHYADKEAEGAIRGVFLTVANVALVASQFIVGFILLRGELKHVYLLSLPFLVLLFIIFKFHFCGFIDRKYHPLKILRTAKAFWSHKEIGDIYMISFLLQLFYAIMVVYTPVYLHSHMGFSLPEIGVLFGIMLTPFILLEIPLGRIADKILGEKEILIAGFIVIAFSTAAIAFIEVKNIVLFGILLFITRIGASAIEIMSESYFFKHVNEKDASLVSAFRTTRPFSLLTAPLLAALFLPFIEYRFIFLLLGILMLYGLRYAIPLRDTR